ncbi:hypothetical protein U9M48_042460 [Paspalum notatum var. saurae]|uniref:RWP-RK domain-containing protein n=1 Tax=Paspalum notatum var. saurae TaxID=547442 RepID=A0AAQ3USW8_PASNO
MPDGEPAETHVGAPPQNVPLAVQGGVAPPTPPNPSPAAVSFQQASTNNDAHKNHLQLQAMAMEVQAPQPCSFFPGPEVAGQGRSDDPMPSFDGNVLPNIGAMSLYDNGDQLMADDGDDWIEALINSDEDEGIGNNTTDGSAVAEDDDLNFVPFVRGQLDCSKCRSVREVLHESANHKLYFIVHVAESGTFQHAIIDRLYIDADGQSILNELMYHDLSQHTYEWVHNFIANSVVVLENDTSGQLKDSCPTFCTNTSTSPANTDTHKDLEMDMLKQLFSASAANSTEAAGVPQSVVCPESPQPPVTQAEENITNGNADGMLNAANWPGLVSPAVLESSQVSVQDGVSSASATGTESLQAKQRQRIAQMTMQDIMSCIHMSREDAAKQLNISTTSLKRLCRKNNTDRWPARMINSLENKIKKLEQAARKNAGTIGLLAIKEKLDKLKLEKAQLFASIMKTIQENKHKDGAGSSGSK